MFAFFILFPLGALGDGHTCTDSTSWYKKGAPSKDCAWVASHAPRCRARGFDNIDAWYACPEACGTECDDNENWVKNGGQDFKTCSWASQKASRCAAKGTDTTTSEALTAQEACPVACNPEYACSAPATSNFVWVEEVVSPVIMTTVSNPRSLFGKGDTMPHDTYAVQFCSDDYFPDYQCIIHCNQGEIDYSMCGPGGDLGTGEEFVQNSCIDGRETAMHKNCGIDFDSEEKFGAPCFDGTDLETLGDPEACQHTWQEWWDLVYDYAKTYITPQLQADSGYRTGGSDTFLPHSDANLIKLGFAVSFPDTRFSTIYGEGWFSQVVPDWLGWYCNITNNTAQLPGEDVGNFEEDFVNTYYEGGVGTAYVGLCQNTDLQLRGFMDLIGTINLITLTSSDGPELIAAPGPEAFYSSGYVGDRADVPFDGSTTDGNVFWPELDVDWQCFIDFVPFPFCNNDAGAGVVVFSQSAPSSYSFDMPVQIDSVGLGSYDPCINLDNPVFFGLNASCFHFHQGGPHFRNGQMSPWYPILLDGKPDFKGVCTNQQMLKARYLPDTDPDYPGLNFFNTSSEASETFNLAGGINVNHGKSFGIHFCVDPNNIESPVICLLNHFSGFPNLGGIANQMILSPLSFIYEWYTDRDATCEKSQKHYCPYDDYWMTVVEEYEGGNFMPKATATMVRDFEAAQTDCIENGNCDPEASSR